MAIRYAVANGFADVAATWDGGTLPACTDDLYANNFTVSIRANLTANSLKKISNASPVIAAGGGFVVTAAATVTITAGIAAADNVTNSTVLLTIDAGSAAVTVTTPTIVGGTTTGRVPLAAAAGYTGALTVNANITGGTGATAFNVPAACTVAVNGTVTNGSNSYGIDVTGTAASVTVTGNIVGSASNSSNAIRVNGSGATLTVTGNVTGGSGTSATVLISAASVSATITGDITGGSNVSAFGVTLSSGSLTVRGTLRPGSTGAGCPAVVSSGVFRYSGHIYSGGMSASTGPNGYFPINGTWSAISGEEVYLHVYDDGNFPSGNNGTARTLTRYGTDLPDQADVRDGTTYGPSAGLTGTLAVPPAASVAAGVPVDDTVGTAAVKLSDIAAVQGAQIAAATSG